MSGVITHAYTPWLNVDVMSEQECRAALKDLLQEAFAKDQQLIELKIGSHKLNDMLVKLLDLFISENYSKLHAEMKPMAEYLQEQRAAKAARKVH
ncbi:hypothetical protein P3W55_29015 [Pseudomonas citronellolis]|uniref:DUF3077 domain-containing protein n=1 Tax=Pseudomonas citronellolis TaxID=53408 RepID=A0AAW6PE35_9PSED|nr:hypothetical protein [Pseudomonas citronellolis]MDF3845768.1 hypothetical protein [Pseudomonas citronellolis]